MDLGIFISFLVLTLFFSFLASQEPNTDEFFLLDFLQNMSFNSSSAIANSEFGTPVCSWEVVLCDDQDQFIISVAASGLGLTGHIPENTIGKLSKLQHLDLSNNNITGLSSDFWGLGSNLKSLNLSHNHIIGPLPNNIGNFGLLEALSLSNNSFEGSIPSALLNCQALVSIDFSSNRLNGTVPDGFSSALGNLNALNLARNQIHGTLSDFSGLESVTYLNLSRNLFQGPLVNLFEMPLQVLDLSHNQLQGHLSEVLSNSGSFNWSAFVFLDLSENQLSGELQFFCYLNQTKSLKHLNIAHNRFSEQEFPPHLDNFLGLQYLNLSKTSIRGQIPIKILQLNSLETLDLSQNHLIGHVPDLGSDLKILDLSQNSLTGEIPYHLVQRLPQMMKFNFSYNNLSLCTEKFLLEMFRTAFFESNDNCPIAANTDLLRKNQKEHESLKLVLAIVLSVVCFVVGLVCLAVAFQRKTRRWVVKQLSYSEQANILGPFSFQTDATTWVADVKLATSVPVIIFDKPLLNFTFADLLSATSNFDQGTLLLEGKFGPVYRGFLPRGIKVAVKVLVHGSTESDQDSTRELERLGQIKHPNLVPLIGYCLAGEQRIAIYEYMENGNLQSLLHASSIGVRRTEDWSTDTWQDNDSNGIQSVSSVGLMTWEFRHRIAIGVARALAFLHHGCFPQIIHTDVKSSSIYLGLEMEPRLSEFGLAKIVRASLEDELSQGSHGYTPPEYFQPETTSATSKSDVYGFGVILFELITGKKPVGDDYLEDKDSNLVNWVRRLVRKSEGSRAIDPRIQRTGSEVQMVEALRIGYLCTADLPSKRPSMQQIVGLLKDIEPVTIR